MKNNNEQKPDSRLHIKTSLLYAFSLVLTVIFAILLWKNTYMLGFLRSSYSLKWRFLIIPFTVLITVILTVRFLNAFRNNGRESSYEAGLSKIRIMKGSLLVLVLCLSLGLILQFQSSRDLRLLQEEAALSMRRQWQDIHIMTMRVNDFYSSENNTENYLTMYVSHISTGNVDKSNTNINKLLRYYNAVFMDLNTSNQSDDYDKKKQRILDMSSDLLQLSKEVLDKTDQELAALTRSDSKKAENYRSKVNRLVEKHLKGTGWENS